MIKNFDIKLILMSIKQQQVNDTVDRVHQVILNRIVIKYIDNKVFDHIDPWVETLVYIAWTTRASYHHTIMAMPGQVVFGRDMLFKFD